MSGSKVPEDFRVPGQHLAAFIDDPPADPISNAAGDRGYVCAQVLAPGAQLRGGMAAGCAGNGSTWSGCPFRVVSA